jgi:hypothetical protein
VSDLSIVVAGDLLAQDVLVSLDPSYEFNPQGRTQDINTYKQLSGAAMLEFLLRSLSKRKNDTENPPVWGPVLDPSEHKSLLENNPAIIENAPGETITLDRCTTRNTKAEPLSPSYRQTNLLGVRAGVISRVVKQALPSNLSCLCLSIDHGHFLAKAILADYFDGKPTPKLTVARILYRPLSSAAGRSTAKIIAKNLKDSLGTIDGVKIGVVSSESLRSMGFEISYRVSWERSISDVYRHLRAAKNRGRRTDYLLEFDYLVITFYNDAALIINVEDLKGDLKDEDTHGFIFIPSAIEGDLVHLYEAPTRGTETIITASLAHHLTGKSQVDFEEMRKAVLYGLKASRFLQVHGFVEVCKFAMEGALDNPPKRVDECMKTLVGASDPDCTSYVRNRKWSAMYFKEFQSKIQGWAKWPQTDTHRSGLVTWPFGDIIDIIALGELESGGFPPKKISINDGRLSLQRSTSKSATAWEKCGWLGMANLPLDKLKFDGSAGSGLGSSSNDQKGILRYKDLIFDRDLPWWSLREHCVTRLSKHLKTSTRRRSKVADYDFENAAAWYLCEFIVRYGLGRLNARSEDKKERLDYAIVDSIERSRTSEHINDAYRGKRMIDGVESVLQVFKSLRKNWHQTEAHLGAIPELTIGKLHSINRRDMENFRVVRERLVSYRDDDTRKPLSVLVVGPPGAGKGFAVKELITDVFSARTDIEFLTFNLANFAAPDALAGAFLEIQEAHLKGHFPVAVWDEYDTTLKDKALGWLPYFLGPMQDGNFFLGDKLRSLPKCVFVFAGSMFSSFGSMRALNHASEGKPIEFYSDNKTETIENLIRIENLELDHWRRNKGRDFKSRLNAILNISGVDPGAAELVYESKNNKETKACSFETLYGGLQSYRFRRAVALRSIFERHRPDLFDSKKQLRISQETLITLLGEERFDHGVRSMENLIVDSHRRWRGTYDSSAVPVSLQVSNNANPNSFDVGRQDS